MELADVLTICRAWDKLGWAVQEQLEAVAAGQPIEEQNPNAMEMVRRFLTDVDRIVAFGEDEQLAEEVTELHERIARSLEEQRMDG